MAENTIDYASFQGLVSNEDLDAMAATLSKLLDEEGCELVSVLLDVLDVSNGAANLCFCVRDRKTGYKHTTTKKCAAYDNRGKCGWVVLDVRAYASEHVAEVEVIAPSVAGLGCKTSE